MAPVPESPMREHRLRLVELETRGPQRRRWNTGALVVLVALLLFWGLLAAL